MPQTLVVKITLLLLLAFSSTSKADAKTLLYCTSAEKIDYFPFRKFVDVYDLTYLLLLSKSYISTDPSRPGILSKWYFSSDGKKLTATVASDAKWVDGTKISARDAAYSIAKTLSFRPLGKRVKIVGGDKLSSEGWHKLAYRGIRILSASKFELTFRSEIKQLAGTLKEALSTNSRHNRIWPARLSFLNNSGKKYKNGLSDLVSHYKFSNISKNRILLPDNIEIQLFPKSGCVEKMNYYPLALPVKSTLNNYSVSLSNTPQVMMGFVNSNKAANANKSRRIAITSFLRESIKIAESPTLKITPGIFEKFEQGFLEKAVWPSASHDVQVIKTLHIGLWSAPKPRQAYFSAIKSLAENKGIKLKFWIYKPADFEKMRAVIDVFIASTRIESGRQVWLQDLASDQNGNLKKLLNYPATNGILEKMTQRSSSTIPVDKKTLEMFSRITHSEMSLFPIARRYLAFYSRIGTEYRLVQGIHDELQFRRVFRDGK